jgi:hypothetical protein
MDLSKVSGCSEDIYLQDISEAIKEAEEGFPREQQLVISINFINEGDRIQRESLNARRETHVLPDKVIEISTENRLEQAEMEAFLTLNSVRNLLSDGKEVLPSIPVKRMGKAKFSEIWRNLPPIITNAIHLAVRLHNTEWDWEG